MLHKQPATEANSVSHGLFVMNTPDARSRGDPGDRILSDTGDSKDDISWAPHSGATGGIAGTNLSLAT